MEINDAYSLIRAAEATRRARYQFVVRARFDVNYAAALPPLQTLRRELGRRSPLIAHLGVPCTCPANTFGAEVADGFALVPRRWADVYFTMSQSRHWCNSGTTRGPTNLSLVDMCEGSWWAVECKLTLHLAENNISAADLQWPARFVGLGMHITCIYASAAGCADELARMRWNLTLPS